MPKRISLVEHLSVLELEKLYRQAKDARSSRHYQIIWLLAQGKKTEEVEEITCYSRTRIYTLVKRYNQLGIEGLGDRRQGNPGAKPLVSDIDQAQLWQALQERAPDGGLWNGRKVADWLTEVTGTKISRQRGWEILRKMGFRFRVPRPCHTKSNEVEQLAWKKKLAAQDPPPGRAC